MVLCLSIRLSQGAKQALILTDDLCDEQAVGKTPDSNDDEEYVERLLGRRPEIQHHEQDEM